MYFVNFRPGGANMGCGSSATQGTVIKPTPQQDIYPKLPAHTQQDIYPKQPLYPTIQQNQAVQPADAPYQQSHANQPVQAIQEHQASQPAHATIQEHQASQSAHATIQQSHTFQPVDTAIHDSYVSQPVHSTIHETHAIEHPINTAIHEKPDILGDAKIEEEQPDDNQDEYSVSTIHETHAIEHPINTAVHEKPDLLGDAKIEEENSEDDQDEYSVCEYISISDLPEIDENKEFPVYTNDDVAKNNTDKGTNNWFLYGRKVYSLDLFIKIVLNRVQDYLNKTNQKRFPADAVLTGKRDVGSYLGRVCGSYPVYIAAYHGVRREEMEKVLAASQIGKLEPISREEYISKMKQSVDIVKSDLESEAELTEYLADYLEQLSRWLYSYPNVEIEQSLDRTNADPNKCEFPLPDKVRADCSVIRRWARDWVGFDMTIDEGGAWFSYPLLNEDWGDVHQTYVDTCALREDPDASDLDMEIDGEAAWHVIPVDVVKNDETTEQQEATLNCRKVRKYLNDPERMRKRRKQIAERFLKRYHTKLKPDDMVKYENWADRLEQQWKEFETLCETFVPRQ